MSFGFGRAFLGCFGATLILATLTFLPAAFGQATTPESSRSSAMRVSTPPAIPGIAQFRSRLVRIQATLDQNPQGTGPVAVAMNDGMGASAPATQSKPLPAAAGCCASMMGKMNATGPMPAATPSELPGFPGVSHLYHVGATGFFLDYSMALKLRPDQHAALNRIKEKSVGQIATAQRGVDQAEQELFGLTAANQPDDASVQTKVREIEKLRSTARMNFIRAVGEAVNVLTHEQHRALLGTTNADEK